MATNDTKSLPIIVSVILLLVTVASTTFALSTGGSYAKLAAKEEEDAAKLQVLDKESGVFNAKLDAQGAALTRIEKSQDELKVMLQDHMLGGHR
jgi:uncharacterized membrane protein YdfJ with MMPL/SSD domain